MIKNIETITVLGGGSAGWMSAAILIKYFPNKTIRLVESPNIPTIGVGESTLGRIKDYCAVLDIDEKDFMEFTDASYKMSIKFTDFYKKDYGHFHYPFGTPYLNEDDPYMRNWLFRKTLYPETHNTDFVNTYFPAAALFETGKFSLNDKQEKYFGNYDPKTDVAYHFDAVKFGLWLKERYCLPRGVEHVLGTVEKINQSDNGIESLELDTGVSVVSDLFVDCSGFRSVLLGGALKVPFNSYADMLPNNKAWACQVPYIDKEKELELFTNCTAIENGWCWNTPLWSRLGTGYVFSDKYVSSEQALEEFKNYLCSDKMVIPRTREQIEKLSFREVPFRVGIHKETFVKNVVAIGLSAGFLEPLESNGLFSVHEFLFLLLKTLSRNTVTQWDRDVYNTAVGKRFRDFAQFIALHYALSNRQDTEYWRAVSNKQFSPELVELKATTAIGFNDLQHRKMFSEHPDPRAGITYVAAGMNYYVLDTVGQKWHEGYDHVDHKKELDNAFKKFDMNKEKWRKAAEQAPTLYQHLKKHIFRE